VRAEGARIEVAGTPIWYRTTGVGDGPPLVLVHGSGANHWWWFEVVPWLEKHHRVVVVDLSGHGDSGHRDEYAIDLWVEEVTAVVDTLAEPVVLVGHSLGGKLSLLVAARRPEAVRAMALLDVPLTPESRIRPQTGFPAGPQRYVAGLDDLVARFRLSPAQPMPPEHVVRAVAEGSARATPEGWTWKYDRRGMPPLDDRLLNAAAGQMRCPALYVHGSESALVDEERLDHACEVLSPWLTVVKVDGAHHHLVLEEPQQCATLIHDFAATL